MQITNHAAYVEVVNTAKYHNYLYFVKNAPVITDAQYDELYFAIQDYEDTHPGEILPDSPTQSVGADGTASKRNVLHRTPMMSTKKCKTVKEVKSWMDGVSKKLGEPNPFYCVEWKYDGCSCSLVYQDGFLIEASTRGDYTKGLDILQHVQNIPSIPKVLNHGDRPNFGDWVQTGGRYGGRIEVRGEILMPFDNIEKTNGMYADARTAAASILNTEGASPYDGLLEFYAWQLLGNEATENFMDDDHAYMDHSLDILEFNMGFNVNGYSICRYKDVEWQIERITEARPKKSFPTDGILIKVNDRAKWEQLGRTEHHPNYCIAYKFPPQTAQTTVTRIEITVGEKTGKRTPIIYFEPVEMNGKTYVKASGGSEAMVEKLGIKVGSRVQFSLRNDVIPHIDCTIE